MSYILGIIGGGQLGMMLTEASKKFPNEISKVIVLDPTDGCPASKVGAEQIVADFKDENAIKKLAEKCDIITYEIESGNSDVLKSLENKTKINPSPETLKIIQDKLKQKTFLQENNIPVSDFMMINSLSELENGINKFRFPALLKTRRDAYDGRGNYKINSKEDIEKSYNYFKGKNLMLEKFIDFDLEVSVIAARSTKGEISTFPLVENIHEDNILKITVAPARVSEKIANSARDIAEKTMTVLKGAGVFGIEMFVDKNEDVLINEIAPRVHNSGHHTLHSSKTSQFEQHLRAILGLKLGETNILHKTIMYNILGPSNFQGKYKPINIESQENVFLKMYQKLESKPKRKLGHVNLVAKNSESIDDLFKKIEKIKDDIVIQPLE